MLTFAHKTSDATHQLIERLQHEVHDAQPGSVVFIAARRGEGTSTIAHEYAMGLALEAQQKVLVVHAGSVASNHHISLCDVAQGRVSLAQAITEQENNVYYCQLGNGESASAQLGIYETLKESLSERADVIVIDSPSLEHSGLGILLATKAEAVVMVVAAETTPQPVVRNLQERLTGAGALVAGVVLNKRRYYIPQRVYAKL